MELSCAVLPQLVKLDTNLKGKCMIGILPKLSVDVKIISVKVRDSRPSRTIASCPKVEYDVHFIYHTSAWSDGLLSPYATLAAHVVAPPGHFICGGR